MIRRHPADSRNKQDMPSEDTQFKKGQSGNPAGKTQGTKNKVTIEANRVTTKLLECFQDEDIEKMATQIKEKGSGYFLKLLGSTVSKDVSVSGIEDIIENLRQAEKEAND